MQNTPHFVNEVHACDESALVIHTSSSHGSCSSPEPGSKAGPLASTAAAGQQGQELAPIALSLRPKPEKVLGTLAALYSWRWPEQGRPGSDSVPTDTGQELDWVGLPSLPFDVSLVVGDSVPWDPHSNPGHTPFYSWGACAQAGHPEAHTGTGDK